MKLHMPHRKLWSRKRQEAVAEPGAEVRRKSGTRMVAVLPTLFTLANVLCGFAAIFVASRPEKTVLPMGMSIYTLATLFIFLGMVMDALDGRVARMTKTTSSFGEQLDSMADMVTFGIAPAFIAVQLVGVGMPYIGEPTGKVLFFHRAAFIIALIYISCTAIRLARFNVEVHLPSEADHGSFKGIPSPGAAGTVASLIILHQHLKELIGADNQIVTMMPVFTILIMLLVAFAMVSRLRYVHLANRFSSRGKANITKVAWLVVVVLLLAIAPQVSLAMGFTIYALSAPTLYWYRKLTGMDRSLQEPPTGLAVETSAEPTVGEHGTQASEAKPQPENSPDRKIG
jgi:CDP-diacylglycerol--serine O-phosphatidyltransferase